MNRTVADAEGKARIAVFRQALQELGWTDGGNVQIEIRWGEDDSERERRYAPELVALAPEVILAAGTLSVAALQRVTRTLPIVFAGVGDPVGAGFVNSLAQPGGNTTGFMLYEYTLSAKWIEILKQVAPQTTRLAVLRDPTNPANVGQFASAQAAAQPLGLDLRPVSTRDAGRSNEALPTLFGPRMAASSSYPAAASRFIAT